MYELERISIRDWNTIEAEDITMSGSTGIIGATGTGKSSLLDAIQCVIAGGSVRGMNLNASTEGNSNRNLLEYCLGYVDDLGSEPLRDACETTIVLSFRDTQTKSPISIGMMINATKEDNKIDVKARFLAHGFSFKIADFIEHNDLGEKIPLSHDSMLERMRATPTCRLETSRSARVFVETYLQAMRRNGAIPSYRQFTSNFRNMVAFKPVDDATTFVRRFMLPEDNLNVERIQSSIAHWRELEEEVQKLETQLAQIKAVRKQFESWANKTIELNSLGFQKAYCERLRYEFLQQQEMKKVSKLSSEIEVKQKIIENHNVAIKEIDDSINIKRILISSSNEAAQHNLIDMRIEAARSSIDQIIKQLFIRLRKTAKLIYLQELKEFIPIKLHGALSAAEVFLKWSHADLLDLKNLEDEILNQEKIARSLVEATPALIQINNSQIAILGKIQEDKEDLAKQLSNVKDGNAIISQQVQHFLNLLSKSGIHAHVLPDLVEISDSKWAFAMESILGLQCEAVFVAEYHEHKAFEILYANRRTFSRCRLVRTSRLMNNKAPELKTNALAEVAIPFGDMKDIVRRFIDFHTGRIIRVETLDELNHETSAIMPDGRTAQGVSKRVFDDKRQLILGKTAQKKAHNLAKTRLDELEKEILNYERDIGKVRDAIYTVNQVKDDDTPSLVDCFSQIANNEAQISSAKSERAHIEDDQTLELRTEIDWLKAEREKYTLERDDETIPSLKRLEENLINARADTTRYESGIEDSLSLEQETIQVENNYTSLIEHLENPVTIQRIRNQVEASLLKKAERIKELPILRNQAEEEILDTRVELRKLTSQSHQSYNNFLRNTETENELTDSPEHEAMFHWTILRQSRLERNELIPHKNAVMNARSEMEAAFKEDLLTKMADKFKMLKQDINKLNSRLKDHRFTGMRYWFSHSIDPAMSQMYNLAMLIAENPDNRFEKELEKNQTLYHNAMEQLEAILTRDEDTARLKDYRNYFTFELLMESEEGVRTNLDQRSKKGSGGQKQAPFYVAIAASMASIYYPQSHNIDPDGMGLVIFDEAFDKLDIPNTQAVLRFFKNLNLQVIVAAPEEKRMSFMEVLDTIISINKLPSENIMHIDSEHIGPRAREEMYHANPEHLGINNFREKYKIKQVAD